MGPAITASHFTPRTLHCFTTHVETEIYPASQALPEDYRFSRNRKSRGLEARIQVRVKQNTQQERFSQVFPARRNQVLQSSLKPSPVLWVESEEKALLPDLKPRRISQKGSQASQINSKRATFAVNLSTCLPKVPTQPTMQETPVVSISAPQTWGAEMDSFPMEEEFLLSLLKDQDTQRSSSTLSTQGVENSPSTGKSLYRDFNTLPSAVNTPEITDFNFEENFEEFFTRNSLGIEAMKTNETPMDETDFSQPEEIWGYKTFNDDDDDDFGVCAPPSIGEGTTDTASAEEVLFTLEAPVQHLTEEAPESNFDIEANDVLKWIIDDQQIEDLPIFEHSQPEEISALHTVALTLPEQSFTIAEISEASAPVEVEVKTEDLGEDEKYRKMRIQNNEASRKCRLNRKRKHQDMEEECKHLEERNVFLKTRLEEMEQEVKVWKKKLLSDIKNTSALSLSFLN